VKPADHPEFFRSPPPEGRSRESSIRLDSNGRFWHEGRQVAHEGLAAAFHRWIRRHPDDGRFILSNGYDWTYFTVEDAPYFIRSVVLSPDRILIRLSDGTEEAWDPEPTRIGAEDALYALVKRDAPGGPYEAKFTRHAQAALAPALGEEGPPAVTLGGRLHVLGAERARFG
jgi:hypothetical protein